MALREDQLLAQVDDRQLLPIGEHRLERAGVHQFRRHSRRPSADSRRLLRRHLLDLARGEIEAHALDLVEVGAGHADEAGVVGIIDRMDGAVLIDAGVSRQQAILLDRLELGLFGIGAVVLALPLDHVGVVRGLAVDRPRRAVVVRGRDPSLVVDMGEDLESEIGVLVQHLQAARHLLAAIGLDEVAVREQLLEFQANLFAALGAAIAGENGAAIRHELIEVIGHRCLPGDDMVPSFAHRAGERQTYGLYDSRHSLPLVPAGSLPLVPAKAGTQSLALDSRFRGNARSFAVRSGIYRGSCNPLTLTLSPTGERESAPRSAMTLSKAWPSSSASAALIRASSVAPELLRPSRRGTTTTSLSNLAWPRSWVSP